MVVDLGLIPQPELHNRFNYTLNTTFCGDGAVCPNNFFSTSKNKTCCDNHQGKTEVDYHNPAQIPKDYTDLPEYYAAAGYRMPTSREHSTGTASIRSSAATSAAINSPPAKPSFVTVTAPALGSPSVTPSLSSSLSVNAKAGIGVGTSVGALAIISFAITLWIRRRRYRREERESIGRANSKRGVQHPGEPFNEQTTQLYANGELQLDLESREEQKAELQEDSARIELESRAQQMYEVQG
ncbi:MAG: hypothetical protein Q9201_000372 [Fulgogasparrea decipioides]